MIPYNAILLKRNIIEKNIMNMCGLVGMYISPWDEIWDEMASMNQGALTFNQ